VASDLARGTADYARFVRRHTHLHAPCEDGSIETGVSHVHGALSPYAPPAEGELAALNGEVLIRSADRLGVRRRWRIGEPYVGEDLPVLVARPAGGSRPGAHDDTKPASGLLLGATSRPPRPSGPLVALRLNAMRAAYPTLIPLDRVARGIVAAYVSLGEVRPAAGESLALSPRPGGIVRCALAAGDAHQNALLTTALEEAISPAHGQRYVVSRPVWPIMLRSSAIAWRALTFRALLAVAWHPVPSDLGSRKNRALAYHAAWRTHVGAGELLFAGREAAAGRDELIVAAATSAGYVTSRRTLWH